MRGVSRTPCLWSVCRCQALYQVLGLQRQKSRVPSRRVVVFLSLSPGALLLGSLSCCITNSGYNRISDDYMNRVAAQSAFWNARRFYPQMKIALFSPFLVPCFLMFKQSSALCRQRKQHMIPERTG